MLNRPIRLARREGGGTSREGLNESPGLFNRERRPFWNWNLSPMGSNVGVLPELACRAQAAAPSSRISAQTANTFS